MISCDKIPAKDKGCHLIVGFLIGLVISLITHQPVYGIIVGSIIGVLKEVYDKYIKKTHFDLFDMIATILGSIIGVAMFDLIDAFL